MSKRIATWIGLALLGLATLYLIGNIAGVLFEDIQPGTILTGGVIGTVGIVLLAVILLPVLLILVALRIAKNEKFGGAHAVAIIAILVTLGGLYWYADHRAAKLGQVASGGSTSVSGVNTDGLPDLGKLPLPPPGIPQEEPDPVFAPIKVSAARHAKMCAILDPVEDAEPRRLARCP